jgi:hypothetical protein
MKDGAVPSTRKFHQILSSDTVTFRQPVTFRKFYGILSALREMGLEGKWPESMSCDVATLLHLPE